VLPCLTDALLVGGADDVDGCVAHVAGDNNDGKLLAEVGKAGFGCLRAEENQRCRQFLDGSRSAFR
jgi:hypothetical protein